MENVCRHQDNKQNYNQIYVLIPQILNLMDQLGEAKFFQKLIWIVRPGDEWKTTFKTNEGLYE